MQGKIQSGEKTSGKVREDTHKSTKGCSFRFPEV